VIKLYITLCTPPNPWVFSPVFPLRVMCACVRVCLCIHSVSCCTILLGSSSYCLISKSSYCKFSFHKSI
jgi:hypothetical protein